MGDVGCVRGLKIDDFNKDRRVQPRLHAVAEVWPRDILPVPFFDVDVLVVGEVGGSGRGGVTMGACAKLFVM